MKIVTTDYCVIGSGITGLYAALTLADTHQVLLITKQSLIDSNTYYAQGGIAAALSPLDNPEKHIEDTLNAGDGECDEETVRILVEEGIQRVQDIIQRGVPFDSDKGKLTFTKEGAHQEKRILHVKDATGKAIVSTLKEFILSHPNITLYEQTTLYDLHVQENTCHGCYIIKNNQLIGIQSKAVLLATGGAANVYWPNTNPHVATGDGIAIASLHGAQLRDMEFMQFHPTAFLSQSEHTNPFLISEAVRGEGGRIVFKNGDSLMKSKHPLGDLAPRDVVSRHIYEAVVQKKQSVYLDVSPISNFKERFPTITQFCLTQNIDPDKDLIPIFPAAHYFMGGISTTAWGETTIKHLYAAGECAALGIHGGNRLASNSLLEGLVFGYRASQHMLSHATNTSPIPFKTKTIISNPDLEHESQEIRKQIQTIMWNKAGIIKEDKHLLEAQQTLEDIYESIKDKQEVIELRECFCLVINALKIVSFSLNRHINCGSFYKVNL